jgi:hypothetical protein
MLIYGVHPKDKLANVIYDHQRLLRATVSSWHQGLVVLEAAVCAIAEDLRFQPGATR